MKYYILKSLGPIFFPEHYFVLNCHEPIVRPSCISSKWPLADQLSSKSYLNHMSLMSPIYNMGLSSRCRNYLNFKEGIMGTK